MKTMEELIVDFPQHLKEATELELRDSVGSNVTYDNVVIIGMGGSGIGGALVKALVQDVLEVPLQTVSHYELPAYVKNKTLVIASSFSGNTEETLAATKTAITERKARVFCQTSGGELLEIAQTHNCPHLILPVKAASPRAHLGFSLVALLKLLQHANLLPSDYTKELTVSAAFLEQEQDSIRKEAKEVATRLQGFLPLIYTGERFYPVGVRLRQQINENAKQLAHVSTIPEMNHNELVGWSDPRKLMKNVRLLFLESAFDHRRTCLRRDILFKLIPETTEAIRFQAKGEDFLTQMLYTIHFSDWLSWYLSKENAVAPFPVSIIEQLKEKLKEV